MATTCNMLHCTCSALLLGLLLGTPLLVQHDPAAPSDLNDRYRVYPPQGEVRGVLVLLPGYGGNPGSFDPTSAQSPSTLPSRLAERGVLTLVAVPESQTLYEHEDAVRALDALLAHALPLHHASGRPMAIGGFSAGGTGAVRYAQYCAQRKCQAVSEVAGVFAVDAPLDLERLFRSAALSAERAAPRTFVAEDHMIVQTLRRALGGAPDEARDAYRLHSAVLASAPDGGNAQLLRDIPIRLYSEPDVQWWIQERNLDYYALNSIDHATLINLLRIAGNTQAELITTTGRGVRPNGQRHPHAWSIVDETDLLDWLLGLLAADPRVTVITPATSRAVNMADNLGAAVGRLPDAAMRRRMIAHVDALPTA